MMKINPSSTAGLAVDKTEPVLSSARLSQKDRRLRSAHIPMRRYEVAYLNLTGDLETVSRSAPDHPTFVDSFAALAHGAQLKTDRGPTPIEDVLPGDQVLTATNGLQTVLWRGAMTLSETGTHHPYNLIRLPSDSLGLGRPSPDLLLGPSARLYHPSEALRKATGQEAAFVPASDFVDGINVVEVTPRAAIQVFQLGFARHERITVNGVDVDSQNPGTEYRMSLPGDLRDSYMSLFPHMRQIEDFGLLMHPRLSIRDLDFGSVA